MKHQPLTTAYGKIKRAKAHIENLEREIRAFIAGNPYKISIEVGADRVKIWRFAPDCVPLDLQDIAADAMHNLRAPLDKMVTAFKVQEEGGGRVRHRYIAFPIGESRKKFEDALPELKKKLLVGKADPRRVDDFIDGLSDTEAYPGGKGSLLVALHDLDIEDKHHPFLAPINCGMRAGKMGGLQAFLGPVLTVGSRRAQHLVYDPVDGALKASTDDRRMTLRAGPIVDLRTHWLEFKPGAHDDFEFATTAEETILLHEFKPMLNVAFGQVHGLKGEPVVGTLHQLSQLVAEILLTFEKRFFS